MGIHITQKMCYNIYEMHTHASHHREHAIAVAAALWAMVAGLCVVAANAWALGL